MLDPENATFIQTGISVCLAACDEEGLPSMARALGCRVLDDGRIVVFLSRSRSLELIADVTQTHRVASVFSLPSTHRTLQLKGVDATIAPIDTADPQLIARHLDEFVQEVVPLGVSESIVRAIYSSDPSDVVAVVFTPCAVFTQTPGPKAGEPIG